MFSFGGEFNRLWEEIPKVVTYRGYIKLANEIDSCYMDRAITKTDEQVLLECLERYAKIRKIPTDEDEYEQRYGCLP